MSYDDILDTELGQQWLADACNKIAFEADAVAGVTHGDFVVEISKKLKADEAALDKFICWSVTGEIDWLGVFGKSQYGLDHAALDPIYELLTYKNRSEAVKQCMEDLSK